jgi:hypothetical protein
MTMMKTIVTGLALAACLGAVTEVFAQPASDPHDLTGVWLQTGGGKFGPYPFTPPYQAIADKRKEMTKAGNPYQPAGSSCLPRGLVGMLTTGAYPIEIYQTPKEVMIIKENGGVHRIHLGRKHQDADDLTPLFFGDTIGHWEGDVLVADSISLGATDNIDGQNPHSDVMHVVQRYHRTGPKTLEVEVTVDDAKAFTHAVSTKATFTLQPDYEMQEYYCVNERNVNTGAAQIIAGATK